jgi:hypothetical protein
MAFDDCPRSMFLPCTSSKPQDLRTTPSRVEKNEGDAFLVGYRMKKDNNPMKEDTRLVVFADFPPGEGKWEGV